MNKLKTAILLLTSAFPFASASAFIDETAITTIYEIEGERPTAHVHHDYKIHLEGDSLFVCTPTGIKSIDLTTNNVSNYAFAGREVADYFQKGDTMMGLIVPNLVGSKSIVWLYSEDRGKTFTELDIPVFTSEIQEIKQHPTNPDVVFVMDIEHIWRSKNCGKDWEMVYETAFLNNKGTMEFHPLNPDIICCHSENNIFNSELNISRDGGDTWESIAHICDIADNCMHQMTFHPTNPDIWIAGGENLITISNDAGKTWDLALEDFDGRQEKAAYFYTTVWDHQNDSIIYSAGTYHDDMNRARMVASPDGGKTWQKVFESVKVGEDVRSMVEYNDKLLLFTDKAVFSIKKADIKPNNAGLPRNKTNRKIYFHLNQNTVSFTDGVEEAEIYNAQGMLVDKLVTPTFLSLPKGFYMFRLLVDGEKHSHKVLVR